MSCGYIISPNKTISILAEGKEYIVSRDHKSYEEILKRLKAHRPASEILPILDVQNSVVSFLSGRLQIIDREVYYDGEIIRDKLVDLILEAIKENRSPEPLILFLEKMKKNPNRESAESLWDFLEHNNMPICPNGDFLGYKSVRDDFKDWHTNTKDNSPGQTVTEDRELINSNRNIGCSTGLHVGSLQYVSDFHKDGKKIVIQQSPEDVVSVPHDCNHQKLRSCKYVVLRELEPGELLPPSYTDEGYSLDDYEYDYKEDDYDDYEEEEYEED